MIVLLVMIQVFYCTNTREYTNIPSCSGKLVFDSSRLQEGIYTLIKLYKKANLNTNPANKVMHVMRLTYARWCACPTDYMNELEYVCLCWRLTGKKR